MKFKIRDIKKNEYGPFEIKDVIHKISPQTHIKFEGENKWQIAGHIKLFQDEFKKKKINSYLPKGRIGRSNYFGYSVLIYFLFFILQNLLSMFNDRSSITSITVTWIFAVFWHVLLLIVLYAKVVFVVRRLHDLSLSGLWCILALPIIPIADLILIFWPGTSGKNKYGHNPKYKPIIKSKNNPDYHNEVKNTSVKKTITKK